MVSAFTGYTISSAPEPQFSNEAFLLLIKLVFWFSTYSYLIDEWKNLLVGLSLVLRYSFLLRSRRGALFQIGFLRQSLEVERLLFFDLSS